MNGKQIFYLNFVNRVLGIFDIFGVRQVFYRFLEEIKWNHVVVPDL